MSKCEFCDEPVDADDPETYHQVVSWVNGPKLDGPKLREQSGLLAHKKCIDHLVHGQAADQPELFDDESLMTDEDLDEKSEIEQLGLEDGHICCPDCGDDPEDHTLHKDDCRRVGQGVELQCGPPWNPWPEDEPLLTDEPGKVTKLTGPNSVHEAIQEHIRHRALALQAEGPDEYPYGYYEDLARTQFEERMERKRRDQS